MKVLLINGSPNEKGCTYTGLKEMEKVFSQNGVETDWEKGSSWLYRLWSL